MLFFKSLWVIVLRMCCVSYIIKVLQFKLLFEVGEEVGYNEGAPPNEDCVIACCISERVVVGFGNGAISLP